MYDFNFADLVIASKKHWKLVLLYTVVTFMVIGAITMFLVPQHWSAQASIALGNQATPSSALGGVLSSALGSAASSILGQLSNQGPSTDLYTLLLQSWDTRRRVVEKCQLQKVVGERLKEGAIDDLAKLAEVDAQPPTSVSVTIYLKGTPRGLMPGDDKDLKTRELCVSVINAYTQALQEELNGLRLSSASSDRIFLEQQMPPAKAKFEEAEAKLFKWEGHNHQPSPTTAGALIAQELITVVQTQIQSQIQAQGDSAAIAEGEKLLGGQKEMLIAGNSESLNPQIIALASGIASVEQQIAQQEVFYHKTPEHPDVQQLLVQKQKLIDQLGTAYKELMIPASKAYARNAVYDQMRGALVAAEVDKTASDAKVKGLDAVLEMGKRQVEQLSGQAVDYARLEEDVVLNQAIYETIMKNYEAALLTEKAEEPIFFIVDPPVVPYKKSSPSTLMAIVVGIFLGVFLGVGAANKRERKRARAREAERV